MGNHEDPYWRLRPELATPADDLCQCKDSPPIVVQDHLSSVPLACLRCNGEVPPERVGFDESVAERLAYWRSLRRSLYLLWLDSSDYEQWAQSRLEDGDGLVTTLGLKVAAELDRYRPTYYWWFVAETPSGPAAMLRCPRCTRPLAEQFSKAVCRDCRIVVPHDPSPGE